MFDSRFLAFVVVAAILTMTPGSDTMLVFRNVLRGGVRAGLITTLGICTGLFAHATLSALGLSAILTRSAELFAFVTSIGAFYLVWLGFSSLLDAWRGKATTIGDTVGDARGKGAGMRSSWVEGLMTNVLNPKVAVFYLAFLPQFIGPGDPVFAKSMLLAATHALMGLVWLSLVASLLARARTILTRGAVRRWMDATAGLVLIGFGVRLAVERN